MYSELLPSESVDAQCYPDRFPNG